MDLDDLVAMQVINDLEEAEEQLENARDKRFLNKTDPFTLSDEQFVSLFRLSKELVRYLINILNPLLVIPRRSSALSLETKIFVTLRFLATGSYQEIIGSNHYSGVSQASVSRCITEVCSALNSPVIFNNWVKFPRNIEELEAKRNRFYEAYHFPGIVGVIDCTHMAIISPPSNNPNYPEHIFVNRKGYHSLNVQLICDHDLRILNVNASFPGSVHDMHIWRESQVSQIMEEVYRRYPENPLFLIGDSGYYLRPWLLKPLQEPETPAEIHYNNRFTSIRSIIERCNGLLKNRFRCLLKHRVLHYTPDKAGLIVNACVVLHNMCIHNNVHDPNGIELPQEHFGIYGVDVQNNENGINLDLLAARRLQRNIMNNLFL